MKIEKPKAYYDNRIRKELCLLGLFGYGLNIDFVKNICFVVKDGKTVGTIKYKKIHHQNKKKNLPAVYGYVVDIDSDDISCHYTRNEDDDNLYFEFDVLNKGVKNSHVELSLDDTISLTIWNEKYGFFDFNLDKKHIYFSFPSKTDNFKIKETVSYGFCDDNVNNSAKEYYYQIDFCKGDSNINLNTNHEGTSLQICGKDYIEEYYADRVDITQRKFVAGKLTDKNDVRVLGTASEMLREHGMGIDSFNHFRYLLDKILPFDNDLIEYIIKTKDFAYFLEAFADDFKAIRSGYVLEKNKEINISLFFCIIFFNIFI